MNQHYRCTRPFHHARDSQAVMMNAVWMFSPCAQIRGEKGGERVGLFFENSLLDSELVCHELCACCKFVFNVFFWFRKLVLGIKHPGRQCMYQNYVNNCKYVFVYMPGI